MNPIRLEILFDDKTAAGLNSVESRTDAMKQYITQVVSALEKEMTDLQVKFKQATSQGLTGNAELAQVQALQGEIAKLKEQLLNYNKVKQTTAGTPIDTSSAIKQTNNLSFSIQQVARELPSLVMGPQMFFLAISNNLPILSDELKKAKAANDALSASGQKGVPVWKQVLSSIMSWQTLMVVGITLSVVYGKQLVEFAGNLWNAGKATLSLSKAAENVNEQFNKNTDTLAEHVVKLRSLQSQWNELGTNLEAKIKFVENNKTAFDNLGVSVSDVKDAESLLVQNTPKVIEAMTLRAKAAAAQNLAMEEYKNQLKAETDKKSADKANVFQAIYYGLWESIANGGGEKKRGFFDSAINDAKEAGKIYQDISDEANKASDDILKALGLDKDSNLKDKTSTDKTNYQETLDQARIAAAKKVEDTRIAILKDSYAKKKEVAENEKNDELQRIKDNEIKLNKALDKGIKNGTVKNPEQAKKDISADAEMQRLSAQKKYSADSLAIDEEMKEKSLKGWIEYNKEFGSFKNKQLAIKQEYELKMKETDITDGEKAAAAKVRDNALNELNFDELKKSINWEQVFGDLDKVSTSSLKGLKTKLKEFMAQNKDMQPENLKVIVDALDDIDDNMSERDPFAALSTSFKDLKTATDEETAAQIAYNKALKDGSAEDKANAAATLESAKNAKQQALVTATNALHDGVGQAKQYVEAGNQVLGIMQTLGIETPEWLSGYMGGVGEMLNGLENIDLTKPMSIVTGSLQTIKGALVSVISLGGLIPGLGGADYSSYNKMKEQYDALNTVWDQLIQKKQTYIDMSYGSEAAKVGKEALELQQKAIDSNYTLGLERLDAGASTGSRSIGVRQRKSMNSQGWNELAAWKSNNNISSELYGSIKDGRMTGLFDLTAEQLEKLKSDAPTFWAKLDGDVQTYLNNIIDGAAQLEDIQESIKESLTQVSFDSVFDSFVDTLSDMDSSSEDFADNFESYMQKAILSTLVSEKYKQKLNNWYANFAKANEDSNISSDEYSSLQSDWNNMVEDALKERDQLKEIMGWSSTSTSSQSGKSGAFTSLTQEQGTKLEGMFTSVQDHTSGIHQLLKDMKANNAEDSKILAQIAENTSFLKGISEIMKRLDQNGIKIKK